MSFTAQQIPLQELNLRHEKCRTLLRELMPTAQGILIFSRTNVYYLSGSRANGMLWLPLSGDPVLLVRKGEERCRLESSLKHMATFKSYSNIPDICAGFGSPLSTNIAAEMRALPWSLAYMLKERLSSINFMDGTHILNQARITKTAYEIDLLHRANELHFTAFYKDFLGKSDTQKHKVLHEQSLKKLCVGSTEREIAHALWANFFAYGHGGMLRMHEHAQEVFLGKIAVGKNALYPSPMNGPMGLVGEHPSIPFMGNAGNVWKKGQILLMDTGFIHEGYHSSLIMTAFAGKEQNIPSTVRKAHDCCFEVLVNIKENSLNPQEFQHTWTNALSIAKKYGFEAGFMGLGLPKASLAQSMGLAMDEGQVIGSELLHNTAASSGLVFNACPIIALPEFGMVGIRHTFVLNEQGKVVAFAKLEQKQDIVCIDQQLMPKNISTHFSERHTGFKYSFRVARNEFWLILAAY